MATTFRDCLLVNFAVQPAALARHLPAHLVPEVHQDVAFVSIVIAKMDRMRPRALPRMLGITYTQVVYRAIVRCGRERGVTFLRSDADSLPMVIAGNALTFFRFNRASIRWSNASERIRFSLSPQDASPAAIEGDYDIAAGTTLLPPSSHFRDLESAQAFLTELYVAFGGRRLDGRVEMVRIARSPWASLVVPDRIGRYDAMTQGVLFSREEAALDSVFYVRSLAYEWQPLSLEAPTA